MSEGLCTLESHRNLPIDVQVRHLIATNLIDDIIIANCFATEEELKLISGINKEKLIRYKKRRYTYRFRSIY